MAMRVVLRALWVLWRCLDECEDPLTPLNWSSHVWWGVKWWCRIVHSPGRQGSGNFRKSCQNPSPSAHVSAVPLPVPRPAASHLPLSSPLSPWEKAKCHQRMLLLAEVTGT
ncbi:hypothetical protein B0T25DRAFT_316693 [Lasiosphaeria hispida]|uniref:Secreted protein n=1 Tax=Lasiosphaeria hispida TaxID=260671 RepID=A0AAJ0M9J2_9PEZI|nr:hypothetical protein B0T25DRAFT_316693 [Lasiosphaeria hispida]